MDIGDKNKFELEKRTEDSLNYHSPSMSTDWRFGGPSLNNTLMGSAPMVNPMSVCKGDLIGASSCSSATMVDSFCPTNWDHPTNPQNLGFVDINVQNSASTSNTLGITKVSPGALRANVDKSLDMGWNPSNSMLKGGLFLPNAPSMLPQSFSQFPADSGFIERAARFSCFSSGNFSDMANPFSMPDSMSPYSRGGALVPVPQEIFTGSGLKSVSGGHSQKNELSVVEASQDVSLSAERGATEGSPLKNERRSESFMRSHDEAKQRLDVSGNESDEAEFSGSGGQEEPSMLEGTGGSKKRKRNVQDLELDQVKGASQLPGDNTEVQLKGDQTPTSTTNKTTTGKHGKQGSQASDQQKDEYIHVRARRGQATNSHSLAERVRREKISERMKFLQDLVPGCSKVTGKAVMLDEIINYVQSLQRQVEFLSMKLATVNPRLDFSIEGVLAKDILQSRAGPSSSTLGFAPDMTMAYPSLRPSQPGLIQTGPTGMGNSSDALRIAMNSQLATMSGGYKEPSPQLPNVWEDELHNVIQMSFGTNGPPNSQELNGTKR